MEKFTEANERAAVVAEALTWERTAFEHHQCVKGVAADCSTFMGVSFRTVGIFKPEIPLLPPDWWLHTTKELYLEELEKHATQYTLKEKPIPDPADVVIVKDVAIGAKVFSHGAIVVRWPIVIHCFPPCVMQSNIKTFPAFQCKRLLYFDPWKNRA